MILKLKISSAVRKWQGNSHMSTKKTLSSKTGEINSKITAKCYLHFRVCHSATKMLTVQKDASIEVSIEMVGTPVQVIFSKLQS